VRRRVRSEDTIISSDDLVRRNAAFAATGAFAGLPFPTSDTLQVLGCVDSRVDPSDVLGLELGEGVVMRNIGGRITPATLRSWALLGRLGQGQPSSGHLVILHHTDCGITRLTDYPEQLAAFFEIPADELDATVTNADRLGLDLSGVHAVVLSHGHFDHAGGLAGLAGRRGTRSLPMVVHPLVWTRRRLALPGGGADDWPTLSKHALTGEGFDVIERRQPSLLVDGSILITGEVDRTTDFEHGTPPAHQHWTGTTWERRHGISWRQKPRRRPAPGPAGVSQLADDLPELTGLFGGRFRVAE
jgi:Metallo-beta-lactamase superfamily/Carbonic anhydrase